MTTFHDIIATSPAYALTIGGFLIGLAFGAIVSVANYCAMGAVSDWWLGGSTVRLGAIAIAAATAILGAQALDAAGVTDLSRSIYLTPRVNWMGAILGGLVFGYGMVLAGGCPSRILVRAGNGDIRGGVALLAMAVFALAALSGVFGSLRIAMDQATALDLQHRGYATQAAPELLSSMLGPVVARWLAGAVIAGGLAAFALRTATLHREPTYLLGGIGVGLTVVAGWALTGLAYDEFASSPAAAQSLSFVKPVSDAIDWLQRSTALGLPGFTASSVFGVLLGSFLAGAWTGRLRLEGFADRADLARHLGGAAMMGVGGIFAMGCTIGQGVTGLSTLSVQSAPAIGAMLLGAVLALKSLEKAA